jgi:hypothetical protein
MPEITTAPATGAAPCPAPQDEGAPQPLFPPRDADAATYRRWLAASPWPEVVFASAGAR